MILLILLLIILVTLFLKTPNTTWFNANTKSNKPTTGSLKYKSSTVTTKTGDGKVVSTCNLPANPNMYKQVKAVNGVYVDTGNGVVWDAQKCKQLPYSYNTSKKRYEFQDGVWYPQFITDLRNLAPNFFSRPDSYSDPTSSTYGQWF